MVEEQLDYGKLLRKASKYWYIVVLSLVLSIGAAYFHLQTTQPRYRSGALLLIKDDKESGQLNEASFFKDLGIGGNIGNLENEKTILASTPLMQEVVEKLDLQYRYIQQAPLKKWELYEDSPIRVASWEPKEGGWGGLYGILTFQGKKGYRFEIELEDELQEFRGEFGKSLTLPGGRLTLTYLGGETAYPIAVGVTPSWDRAKELVNALTIEMLGEESSILGLSFQDVAPDRARDVLLELIEVYNRRTIETENQVFRNTIELIEDRLTLINDELSAAEQDVQNYKQRFSMTELSAEGTMLMGELEAYNKELSTSEVQLSILESIEGFLDKNKETFDFVPSNLSINNLTLTGQLNRFNELLAEQKRLATDLGPKHQDRILIVEQISTMRETIIESIRSIKGDLLITRNATTGRKNNLASRLRSLPQRERELIEIERGKAVKENLYLYLLQKREESTISMAVTMAKGVIVEPPNRPYSPFTPNKKQILLIAVFLGLALPAGLILLVLQMDDRIYTEEEIEDMTEVPIVGVLTLGRNKSPIIIKEPCRTILGELFRLLRANLAYVAPGQQLKTLLITSSMPGEGKSFIARNLGKTQALTGKKVIVLGLDLRKPKQDMYLDPELSKMGLVDYLIDPSIHLNQIIQNDEAHPNLFFISNGSKVPPNPSELILSPRLSELVRQLKKTFDFIILDSPPVGLVADALQMKDLVDATMYVIRSGKTRKAQLEIINEIVQKDKLPKPFIVLNGLRPNTARRYGSGVSYSYGYGYGNGNGYYDLDEEKKWWQFFNRNGKNGSQMRNGHTSPRKDDKKKKQTIAQEN